MIHKQINKRSLIWLPLFLLGLPLFAQDAATDLARINQFYATQSAGSLAMEYRLFVGNQTQPAEQFVGKTYWKAASYYLQMQETEKLQNDQYLLLVNHEMQTMIIQDAHEALPNPTPVPLDSVLSLCDSVIYEAPVGGLAAYRFVFDNFSYRTVKIAFDVRTYQIRKMIFWEAKPSGIDAEGQDEYARIEIAYRALAPLADRQTDPFSTSRFVKAAGETFVPQPDFQHYQLFNYTR